MAGGEISEGSNMAAFLCTNKLFRDPLWLPSSSAPPPCRGVNSNVNIEKFGRKDRVEMPYFQSHVSDENGDDDFDLCFTSAGKRRRLTVNQVQFLERNFEVENKLEPERKIQLAKELGLQPRQVAIWFQNRRARFKNKQLEKEYDNLKASYDRLKTDYDNLLKENEFLKNEVVSLKDKFVVRDKMLENLEPHHTIKSRSAELQDIIPKIVSESVSNVPVMPTKLDDASSTNFDSTDDSSHSYRDRTDSSLLLEPEQSDFSQEEGDDLGRNLLLLPSPCFQKLCHDHQPANSCAFEYPVEDQPLWSWSY